MSMTVCVALEASTSLVKATCPGLVRPVGEPDLGLAVREMTSLALRVITFPHPGLPELHFGCFRCGPRTSGASFLARSRQRLEPP